MPCYRCGCDNSETARICPGCGLSLKSASNAIAVAPPFPIGPDQVISPVATLQEALGYATMGERFLAFLCDASVATVLEGAFLAVFYSKSSMDFERLKAIALWIIPIAYMTLTEFFFHRTIGKRLLRIQLRSDSPEPHYPSFFRILLRETLGKFVSGVFLGIGFLAGGWHQKHKTWADRIANTVVVRTGIPGPRLKAVLAPILICANLGLGFALTNAPAIYRATLHDRIRMTEKKIDDLHRRIFLSFFSPTPQSIEKYQETLKSVQPMLDEYNREIAEERDLVFKYCKLDPCILYDLNGVCEKVNNFREEILVLVRTHVQNVLAFDPRKHTWDQVLQDRGLMMHAINFKNNKMNQISGTFVLDAISFTGWGTPSPETPKQQR